MGKVCLIRHGETDWNKAGKLQGRTNIALNKTGKEQAHKTGEYLKKYKWDKIISSPLKRAKETAEIISKIIGLNEVEINTNFIERNYGSAEGMTLKERLDKYQDRNYKGMEEWAVLRDRVYSTVCDYAKENENKNIIIISHGGAVNSVLYTISEGKYGSGITKLYSGSLNMLNFINEELKVEFYNMKVY